MAQADKSPHRLKHVESVANEATTIGAMKFGDVFVREGTPCMRLHVCGRDTGPPLDAFWIVNLTNGKAWPASEHDVAFPATNVKLTFDTTRR